MVQKILLAINNLYALKDTIIGELDVISEKYSIDILCVADTGRESAISDLKALAARRQNVRVIEVNRVKGFCDFVRVRSIIRKHFNNKNYVVLIDNSIGIEDKILIASLGQKCFFFAVVPTMPTGVLNYPQLPPNLKSASRNRLKKLYFALKERKLSTLLRSSLGARVYLLRQLLLNNFIKFIYDADEPIALRNRYINKGLGYINKGLVRLHFTPNQYWSHIISTEYPGERVVTYCNSTFVDTLDIEKSTGGKKILLLGASINTLEHFSYFALAIRNIQRLCNVTEIFVRPHPRFQDIGSYLADYLGQNLREVNVFLLSPDESISSQVNNRCIDIVLGYYSSVMSSLPKRENLLILVDELLHQRETNTQLTGPMVTGAIYGFNKEISFIGLDGSIYSCLSQCNGDKKILPSEYIGRFSQLLDLEISSLESDS
jgi:hypothetical protein